MGYTVTAIGKVYANSEYATKEDALKAMEEFWQKFVSEYESTVQSADYIEDTDDGHILENGGMETYQDVYVVKTPETFEEQILFNVTRAQRGLKQYAFELADTYSCGCYLEAVKELIEAKK